MVPWISYTTVSFIPVTQLLERSQLDAIVDRTRNGGAEIGKYLNSGSAYYAPSSGAVQLAEAMVGGQTRSLPCAAWREGVFVLIRVFLDVLRNRGWTGH